MRGFLGSLPERFEAFFEGRNGSDMLNRFVLGAAIVVLIINLFVSNFILTLLVFILLFYALFRYCSKNVSARALENARFESWIRKPRKAVSQMHTRWSNRSTTKYFKCAQCGQSLSVPKNKGTLRITCPKCHTQTTIKS